MPAAPNKANVVAMLALAAIGSGVAWAWQSGERAVLEEQARIWASGVPAAGAEVTFEEGADWADDRFFLFRAYHYVLRVTYQVQGRAVASELVFATALRSIDARALPEVRYDAAQPQRFALSWTVERLRTGWAFLCFKWVCGLLWTLMCLWVVSLEYWPSQPQALEAAGRSAPRWTTRVIVVVGFLLVVAQLATVAWAVADDLWRRWDSYLEVFLGLVLGLLVLAAGGWAWERLRGERRQENR